MKIKKIEICFKLLLFFKMYHRTRQTNYGTFVSSAATGALLKFSYTGFNHDNVRGSSVAGPVYIYVREKEEVPDCLRQQIEGRVAAANFQIVLNEAQNSTRFAQIVPK